MMTAPSDIALPASDEKLAALALSAAIEAERRLRDPNSSSSSIDRFLEALRVTPPASELNASRSSLSPSRAHAFSRALKGYSGKEAASLDELAKLVDRLLNRIAPDIKTGNQDALNAFIPFCLALNEELSLRRKAIDAERRPRAKYRV